MSTDPRLDFLDRLQAATTERMRQVERVAEQVGAMTGEATSPDRLVTVKVTPNGGLVDLVLHDDALDLDARDLAALVLATARAATERAASAMNNAVSPLAERLDLGPTDERAPDWPGQGSAAGKPERTEFDSAIERADRVADTVEDRVRGMDARPH